MSTKKISRIFILLTVVLSFNFSAQSQNKNDSTQHVTLSEITITPQQNPFATYRASATKANDLVNTKLEVKFDYAKQFLYGKAWIILRPHFYSEDSLTLDAKSMQIKSVELEQNHHLIPLHYTYDNMQLHIKLDKTYKRGESYTVIINYVSQPEKYQALHHGGSAAMTDDKGLYFINPDGKDPNKPIQIWTQGETESNSVWFPTIDKPDQKCTEQISMTVPAKYVTLSNGTLISQKKNADGTRTDTWKTDLPFSPYLFMMAVGDFAIVKDHYKNLPVNYYVEKKYAPYAKDIFGNTPEMIAFYSKILGVKYPWPKYSQIVVRDYVSGAMENVSATLHGDFMEKTKREMLDNTYYYDEDVIAHELFHQWFGDLVTCESWSNITMNESFADFSEMLWAEHKYGKDVADEHSYHAMQTFFTSAANGDDYNLVRFHYKNREDVFDAVSYEKGGRILNMLRNYVGDSAFFKSLNLYLNRYKFQNSEAQELRLCFEEITGEDLNWFWNEWYYDNSYPELEIAYHYDDAAKKAQVIIHQKQDSHLFKLPMAVDIYAGGNKTRHHIWIEDAVDTFTFNYNAHPDLINVDADKVLLAKKDDYKTIGNYIFQYQHAPLYLDRREAIAACAKEQDTVSGAAQILLSALKDKYYGLRILAMNKIDWNNDDMKAKAFPIIKNIAQHDAKAPARSAALMILGKLKNSQLLPLFRQALNDSSYGVEAAALAGIEELQPALAYQYAQQMQAGALADLVTKICRVYASEGNEKDLQFISDNIIRQSNYNKLPYIGYLLAALAKDNINNDIVKKDLDIIGDAAISFSNEKVKGYIERMLQNFIVKKQPAVSSGIEQQNVQEQIKYAAKILEELKSSGK